MELFDKISKICADARVASFSLAGASGKDRNNILVAMANALRDSYEEIISANKIDLENAKAKPRDKLYCRCAGLYDRHRRRCACLSRT